MNAGQKTVVFALATALGALLTVPASALQISTVAVSFDNSASVTDPEGGNATTNNNASLGSTSIGQFDSSLGVLTGATVNLVSTRTQTTLVQSTDGPNNGNNNQVTSNGSGSSTAALTIPLGVTQTFAGISLGSSCTAGRQEGCTGTSNTSNTSTDIDVASADPSAYVGGGTVSVSRAAPLLSATQSSNVFTGTESTMYTLRWAGMLGATYTYLLHADPSLSDLTLDFGTVFLNDAVAALSFDIINGTGVDRVGLDLDAIAGSGDVATLTTNLATFSALAAGFSNGFLASFDTTSLGDFSASYVLTLSDADVGAANSRNDYTLTLNLLGRVVVNDTSVPPTSSHLPEPGSLALLGLGLGLCGLAAARRGRQAA